MELELRESLAVCVGFALVVAVRLALVEEVLDRVDVVVFEDVEDSVDVFVGKGLILNPALADEVREELVERVAKGLGAGVTDTKEVSVGNDDGIEVRVAVDDRVADREEVAVSVGRMLSKTKNRCG